MVGDEIQEIMERYGRYTLIEFSHKAKNYNQYWRAKCDCGTEKVVRLSKLKSGEIVSCGCFRKEKVKRVNRARRMPKIERKKNLLFSYFKGEADRRDILFLLDKNQCHELSKSDCYYCGDGPKNETMLYLKSDRDKFKYNGIDRIDNDKGYHIDNVVPCCGDCNRAKRTMTQDEFFVLIEKIYKRRIE